MSVIRLPQRIAISLCVCVCLCWPRLVSVDSFLLVLYSLSVSFFFCCECARRFSFKNKTKESETRATRTTTTRNNPATETTHGDQVTFSLWRSPHSLLHYHIPLLKKPLSTRVLDRRSGPMANQIKINNETNAKVCYRCCCCCCFVLLSY